MIAPAENSGFDIVAPPAGWGPDGKRGALSLTFDNFGEASDLQLGTWDGTPIGNHFTVAWLPTLIELLADVKATYFVEASNAAIYPGPLHSWTAAGHEVGIHAWRHEMWAKCEPAERRRLLANSVAAFRSIGIEPLGFRPPGGALPREAWDEFADAGLTYCSDAGPAGVRRVGAMLSLPFEWRNVDAYMMHPALGFLRVPFGDQEQPYTPADWEAALDQTIDTLIAQGGQRTIIFHPAELAGQPERIAVLQRFLDRVRTSDDLWIAPCGDVARFVRAEVQTEEPVAA